MQRTTPNSRKCSRPKTSVKCNKKQAQSQNAERTMQNTRKIEGRTYNMKHGLGSSLSGRSIGGGIRTLGRRTLECKNARQKEDVCLRKKTDERDNMTLVLDARVGEKQDIGSNDTSGGEGLTY